MTRSSVALLSLLLVAAGCGQGDREPLPPVDCSVSDRYEFLNISDFTADTYWYRYGDPTPGGQPHTDIERDPNDPYCSSDPNFPNICGSNVPVSTLAAPGRCGDTRYMELAISGQNFWGAGFGEWGHNDPGTHANGTGYEGISFWARSPRNAEKTFLFGVDDMRTIIAPPSVPTTCTREVEARNCMGPDDDPLCCDPAWQACRPLPVATGADQDLDGDGCLGPGDIVFGNIEDGTRCRLPPSSDVGTADCYNGGVDAPPSGGARVPLANECGNQFHTWITTTETWQLFLVPWNELVQWPCPNRVQGGIARDDIAKFEIKVKQGMSYEIWLDNIAFYRRR